MGFISLIYYVTITTSVIFLVLNHAPNLLDIEPKAYTPKLIKFEGALAHNQKLDKAQIILEDEVLAPESLELLNGEILAANDDGRIFCIKEDRIVNTLADTKGRPLGLRLYNGDLYVADYVRGLLKVDVNSGEVTVLVPTWSEVDGVKVGVLNDLDVHDGIVYFSAFTSKWNFTHSFYGAIEHENSGKVFQYNIATGKLQVLVDGLYYPNGIQLTHDKKAVLIAELLQTRVLRHYLSGPKAEQTEVFVELPGSPDNIRPSSGGGYWVAVLFSRDSPDLSDRLASYPKIRKALARLTYILGNGLEWANEYISSPVIASIAAELKSGFFYLAFKNTDRAVVVEVGQDGKIIRSLQSTNPKLGSLSQGLEVDGQLYLGSFRNPYIAKLKL